MNQDTTLKTLQALYAEAITTMADEYSAGERELGDATRAVAQAVGETIDALNARKAVAL